MRRIASYSILLLLVATPVFATDITQDADCEIAHLFAEGSGTSVDDSSTHSNAGAFKGTGEPAWSAIVPSYHTSGSAAGSVTLDGTDDYIDTDEVLNTNNFSIVVWLRPHSITDTGDDYAFADSGGRIFLRQTNASLFFMVYDTEWRVATKSNCLTANTWVCVVLTKSSTTGIQIYVDNSAGTGDASTANWTPNGTPNTAIGNSFDGEITNFLELNKVLAESERTELYEYGPTGQPAATALSQVIIIGEDYD